jgi:hypothetical protein
MLKFIPPHISRTSFLVLTAMMLVACLGEGTSTGGTASTGTTTGTGGDGGGTIDYPACVDHSAVFAGSIDGQPFNATIPAQLASLSQFDNPHYLDISFVESGGIHLIWTEDAGPVDPVAVAGTFRFPGETADHAVLSESTMILGNDVKFDFVTYKRSHLLGCYR